MAQVTYIYKPKKNCNNINLFIYRKIYEKYKKNIIYFDKNQYLQFQYLNLFSLLFSDKIYSLHTISIILKCRNVMLFLCFL
jgi:hypothetical protein